MPEKDSLMPLIHSGTLSARKQNIAAEVDAGKDPAQAVAIGYSVQRRSKKKKTMEQAKKDRR